MRLVRYPKILIAAALVLISSVAVAQSRVTPQEIESAIAANVTKVPEFVFIREEAERLGLKAYLFGGTAASFAHFVRDDVGRAHGETDLDTGRLDYEFTAIYRSTQDLDIVVDGPMAKIDQLQSLILAKYPTFAGDRGVKWELRSLREARNSPSDPGYKEALLGDRDFLTQNSDSASTGLIEVTTPSRAGHVVTDLRDVGHHPSQFLKDVTSRTLTFYRSPEHATTARAKAGMNPEIFSVIRGLTKAFQFDLTIRSSEMAEMQEIVNSTNFEELRGNTRLVARLVDMAKKLMIHSVDVERSWKVLEAMGLRQELMIFDSVSLPGSLAWWMNKSPLPSKPLGEGAGKTAAEIAKERGVIQIEIAHATRSIEALESIERSRRGEANFFISRKEGAAGEQAVYGDGTYTMLGKNGAFSGPTSRMILDPRARLGSDFEIHGDIFLIKNKNAVRLVATPMMHSEEEIISMLKTKEGQAALAESGLLHRALRKYPDLMDKIFFGNVSFSQSIRLMQNSDFISLLANNDALKSLIRIRMEQKGLSLSEFVKIIDDPELLKWLKDRNLTGSLRDGVMNRLMSARLTLPRYIQIMKVFKENWELEEYFSEYALRDFSDRVASSMRAPTAEDIRMATGIVESSPEKIELWFAAFKMGIELPAKIDPSSLPVTESDLVRLESVKAEARTAQKRGDYRLADPVQTAFSWIEALAQRASNLTMFETIVADGRVITEKYDSSWLHVPFFDSVRGVRGKLTPYAVYHAWREKAPERFKRIYMNDGDYIDQGLAAFLANAKSVKEILELIVDPSKKDYRSTFFGARKWLVPNIDKVLALKPTPEDFVTLVRGELWQDIEGHAAKTLAYAHTPEMFAAVLDTHFTISINGDKNKIPGMRLLWTQWLPKFFAMNPNARQIAKAHEAAKHGDSADIFDAELAKRPAQANPQVARQKWKAIMRGQVRCEKVFAGAGG